MSASKELPRTNTTALTDTTQNDYLGPTTTVSVGPNNEELRKIKLDKLAARVPYFKDRPKASFPESDKDTFFKILIWVLYNTLPKLMPRDQPSQNVLEFWDWNPFKLYNLAIELNLREVQDLVMTRIIQAMREKQNAVKKEWELQHHAQSLDKDGVYETFYAEQDPNWAPHFPTIQMLQAMHNFAPKNSKIREFAARFMAHILLERYHDNERNGNWNLDKVVEVLDKDKDFLRSSMRVLGMYHCYREIRPDWELGAKPSPLAWGGECYYHVHDWIGGGPCEHFK